MIPAFEKSAVVDAPLPSVRRRVATGATLMVLLRLAFRAIGLVSTLILVRLLLPSDFGLVGLATIAYAVFDALSQLSFQLAIVRMATPSRIHYDTAWTMGAIRGFVIGAIVITSSPLVAEFIGEPKVIPLSFVLAALGAVSGLENVALIDFQRNLQFDRIFWYQIAGKLGGAAVAISTAFLLRNYWALICGIVAGRLTTLLCGYVMRPYRPRFTLAGWHDLFNFSKWLMVSNFLSVIDNYCMLLTVGRVAGTAAIGTYQIAAEIGALPASEIAAPARDPVYAGYSQVADNLALLRRHFLSNLSLVIAIITPMSLGICVMAEPITVLMLGQKWMAAIPLIRLTALFYLFEAIGHFAHPVYLTLNQQGRLVKLYAVVVAARLAAVIAGAYVYGVFGAAVGLVLSATVNMVLCNGWVPVELGIRIREFWFIAWRTALASAAMVIAVLALTDSWHASNDIGHAWIRFFAICSAGAVLHIAVLFAAWLSSGSPPSAEAEALQFFRTSLRTLSNLRSKDTMS